MKKFFTIFLLAILLTGCASNVEPAATDTPTLAATDTLAPAATVGPSSTPEPSSTPKATDTPAPTSTLVPSITPTPTITHTPVPDPIVFQGKGSDVVDFTKWNGPALLKVSNIGGSTFNVRSYNAAGYMIEDLVSTIGSYVGTVPLDFQDYQQSTRLEITSGGTWEINILPMNQVEQVSIPGTISGYGDNVFTISGATPDLMKAEYSGPGTFIVRGFTPNGVQPLVSEFEDWNGTVMIDSATYMIEVRSNGSWQIDFTAK